jgi:SAM-dependent methyltransferase
MGSTAASRPPEDDPASQARLEGEQTRIRRVFQAYSASPRRRRAWDPVRPGNRRILIELYDALASRLEEEGVSPADGRELLDIGCGRGPLLEGLLQRRAEPGRLHGVDLLEHEVAVARERLSGVDVRVADARALPYPPQSMDAVVMSTVLSSILDPENRLRVGLEARRVLRPGGCIVVYDFRVPSPRNPNVRPMSKRALRSAFPGCRIDAQPLTLLPPLARLLGRTSLVLYPFLAAMPFFRTHLLTVIRPDDPRAAA